MRAAAVTAVLLLAAAATPAATIRVPEDRPTIQAAIDAADDGDEIILTESLYSGEGNRDVDFAGRAVTVRSASGDPDSCVIDCEGAPPDYRGGFRFMSGEGPGSVVEGVTVKNGWRDVGGAVTCYASSPTLRRCVFVGNSAFQGGAVSLRWSSTLIEDCVIVRNAATQSRGGGVHLFGSQVVLRGCTISDNEAGSDDRRGGGVAVTGSILWPSSVTIERCLVSRSRGGEGIYCDESSDATVLCTDVFDNADGDWIGCIADQAGLDGNFSADPLFCDAEGGDFTLSVQSPALPGNHPDGIDCGLIGALEQGCGPVSVVAETWTHVRGRYRETVR